MGDSRTDELTDVPPQSDRKPPLLRRLWWSPRARLALIAGALVVTLAGLVAPVKLVAHGWQDASTIRGVGSGGGVFIVTTCTADGKNSDNEPTYSCDGAFTRPGAAAVPATVSKTEQHDPGKRLRARIHADGSVELGNNTTATLIVTLWIILALATAVTEALVVGSAVAVAIGGSRLYDAAGFVGMGITAQVLVAPVAFTFLGIGFYIGYSISG